jgi:hypothetical protein
MNRTSASAGIRSTIMNGFSVDPSTPGSARAGRLFAFRSTGAAIVGGEESSGTIPVIFLHALIPKSQFRRH